MMSKFSEYNKQKCINLRLKQTTHFLVHNPYYSFTAALCPLLCITATVQLYHWQLQSQEFVNNKSRSISGCDLRSQTEVVNRKHGRGLSLYTLEVVFSCKLALGLWELKNGHWQRLLLVSPLLGSNSMGTVCTVSCVGKHSK